MKKIGVIGTKRWVDLAEQAVSGHHSVTSIPGSVTSQDLPDLILIFGTSSQQSWRVPPVYRKRAVVFSIYFDTADLPATCQIIEGMGFQWGGKAPQDPGNLRAKIESLLVYLETQETRKGRENV